MAVWTTPVTDRTGGEYMTDTDMTRITGNIEYLHTEMLSVGLPVSGYTAPSFSNDDTPGTITIIATADWNSMLIALEEIIAAVEIEDYESGTDEMTFENINNIEGLTLRVYNAWQIIIAQARNNHYVDTEIYAGDTANVGGIEYGI